MFKDLILHLPFT